MLELIVLGHIPGTNFYVTFTVFTICIITICASAYISLKLAKHLHLLPKRHAQSIEEQAL